ncbi:ABC transporter substrate-binding protein [Cryobacterium tepidiphilum]|uniref:ABC transporter substrate-binding protein n=1 Tax=Cryobacterium tepidiphilum TaxID=2486026 RepID=UPI001F2861CC|nr:ABC transporter substrate-binding protein [Cryobacterium tepidiphilum]
MSGRSRPVCGVLLVVALAAGLSGCSRGDAATAPVTSPAPGDLLLNIGTILPETGTLAALGPPQVAGVDLAVQDINNAAAGLFTTVEHTDSGDAGDGVAAESASALIADHVSAVIGAVSNDVSRAIVEPLAAAGVVQVSASNTATDFSTVPDHGYYWRTAPSNLLQGRALANQIAADGGTRVSILYMKGEYGLLLDSAITTGLRARGVDVVGEQAFKPGVKDVTELVRAALAPKPDALVVVSFTEIEPIAKQLAASGFDFNTLYGVDGNYGVVDKHEHDVDIAGARFTYPGVIPDETFQARLQDLAASQGSTELTIFSYAAEAYDATTLVALAALQGGATDGTTIRDNLRGVSQGGTACTGFASCAALVKDGADIDYQGVSGPVDFDANGDITAGRLPVYRYATGNLAQFLDEVAATTR